MRTRLQYDQAFQIVREVVASWDPYNLIASGGPPDEFDGVIARLLPRLQNVASGAEAAEAVSVVFGDAFGETGFDVGSCADVGKQLHDRLAAAGLLARSPNPAAELATK